MEVGCLYGGMTAVLALAAPKALVYAIDNFSWEPVGPCNAARVRENMRLLGIDNVIVYAANSVEFLPAWNHPIDLAWLDGNHGRFYIELDLCQLATHAQVIAVHDYAEPMCPDVKPAVDELVSRGEWCIAEVVKTIVVLRRR